jgi:glycerol-3-phosphate dehydrogenase subunit B
VRFDALIIGAELDAWVAAARLLELGKSVCIAAPGEGSLHYAAGGLRVLGRVNGGERHVEAPFDAMAALDDRHPYRRCGEEKIRAALAWFAGSPLGVGFGPGLGADQNSLVVTPAGLTLPVFSACRHQATTERIAGRKLVLCQFCGHRDLPVGLIAAELARRGERTEVIDIDPPDDRTESVAIARAFDSLGDARSWFAGLKTALPDDAEVVLLPAVLGHERHNEIVVSATDELGLPVFEVPTLPPCLPGIRLSEACERHVERQLGIVRAGCRIAGMNADNDRVVSVRDDTGRLIEASIFVLATGGVLMGGLQVDSRGRVGEPALGLAVYQTEPLSRGDAEETVAALHRAGVETDASFRPRHGASKPWRNLFVTGRNLAHWDPGAEISADGVAIVSGWAAVEAARAELGV